MKLEEPINIREEMFNLLNRYRHSHNEKWPQAIIASSNLIKFTNIQEIAKLLNTTWKVKTIFIENNNSIMGAFDVDITYIN